ncbi:MAG: polyribonucleotide nucleotidyltransferase [Patescibacteria group bacterium]|nr:polyribonucleotide nucleotidyltransferase [Patescibacteria group bacterium]
MSNYHRVECEFAGRKLILETGKLSFQSNGAVLATYGETVVLATATAGEIKEEADGLPLRVDFEEKLYAGGVIKNSRFIKRETTPSDEAILSGRLIDRGIRPFFPKDLQNEVQLVITVLSVDRENDPAILGALAASAALSVSDVPWKGPLATIQVGLINNQFLVNPTREQMEASDLDLVYTGSRDRAVMVEAGAHEILEEKFIEAMEFAQKEIQPLLTFINDFSAKAGRKKMEYVASEISPEVLSEVKKFSHESIAELLKMHLEKEHYQVKYDEILDKVYEKFEGKATKVKLSQALHLLEKSALREMILKSGQRSDGRKLDELRPISIEVGVLPRTHGSALFTRGLSQALSVVTLGSTSLEQLIQGPEGEEVKRYMHHYSARPFSTGEVGAIRSAGRREIGHGALAERALKPVIPESDKFPYTVRVVSEILSQNGSTSMASVCGSTLSLMDAGVPIKAPVSGISMGLVSDSDKYVLLTDIAGIEDFNGDMDFKSAGSRTGITAVQLDAKLEGGIPVKILGEAILSARPVRHHILDLMESVISSPRLELSRFAPRITVTKIDPKKIGEVIGSGGKTIKNIMESTDTAIEIEDDGTVYISANSLEKTQKAKEIIESLVKEAKVGEIYEGPVTRILDFGAFVEILPGRDGLIHISELANYRVNKVTDVVKIGDMVKVKVIGIDQQGRINLSKKALEPGHPAEAFGSDSDRRRGPGPGFRTPYYERRPYRRP